jgi:hypothetical protein
VALLWIGMAQHVAIAWGAPQAYLIRGTWDQTGVPIGAKVGATWESIWLYDPTPYNENTNPNGARDVTAEADAAGDLDFPGFESWYLVPSPSLGAPDLIPKRGNGGVNYLDVDLANPNNADFHRSKLNGGGEEVDPALIKVWNDVPDFGGLDGIQLIDHVDMNPLGLGPVKRWDLFVPNLGLWSNTALPTNLEFNTLGAPWGLSIEGNAGLVPAGSFDQIPLGDASRDGTVDGADYTVWADNYLLTNALWKEGDFNIDGVVDGGDYTLWADHYLQTIPLSAAATAMAVPEPGSITLAAIGGVLALAARRLKRRCSRPQ